MQFHFSLSSIREAAGWCWKEAGDRKIIAFHGQMGAGKTTFIQALCSLKGVHDTVSSPTFSIINEYHYNEAGEEKKLFHLDLYRLNSEEEAVRAGVEDCFYAGAICLVEWPEKAPGIFPDDTLHVHITLADSGTRTLRIEHK